MMLDTDMCLAFDNNQGLGACIKSNPPGPGGNTCAADNTNFIPMLAANGNCCSWMTSGAMFNQGVLGMGMDNNFCGNVITRPMGA